MMFDVLSEKRLQLVPNWNGITMPDTTPMPNETAKMRIQKADSLPTTSSLVIHQRTSSVAM